MEWYEIARNQRGLVARFQLEALGLTDGRIDTLIANHHWQLLHPGVYLTGSRPPDWEQNVLAAIFACGGDAHASHRTAARLHGLDGADNHGVIDVTVSRRNGPAPTGVIVHRSRRFALGDRAMRDGVPVSSVDRCLLDYAALVPPILVERAVEDAMRRGRTTEGALRRRLEQSGRGVPGVRRLRTVLDRRPAGRPARSGFEVIVLDIIREFGLPLPIRRPLVVVDNDEFFELDLAYVDEMIDIEPSGDRWHSTARQRAADARRQRILGSHGWTIVDVHWTPAIHHPATVAAEIRAALHSGRIRAGSARVNPPRMRVDG
ncbi:MAG TPA: hypothetical protein VFB78_05595 [Acidimicrobiales bacterium]|nr:hypothetical protein [Acidimicrobiales bacterium]